jgi:hypothetical protein|tara:strand:+ start:39 stop:185 length:147 start_codon:yes stop_codon:yes gene_type:complete
MKLEKPRVSIQVSEENQSNTDNVKVLQEEIDNDINNSAKEPLLEIEED